MSKFKKLKQELEILLTPPVWPEDAESIPAEAEAIRGMGAVSPLLAMLPRNGFLKWRAVLLLGRVVPDIAAKNMDDARTVMRRCMWHMNEDSGNMGWGVAEAMGEMVARSKPLADEFGRVILSYVRDTGFADNFVDHPILRRGAYWAISRFSPEYPAYRAEGAELLLGGLADEDTQSRGIAAWGLGKLATAGTFMNSETRNAVAERLNRVRDQDVCEVLDGIHLRVEPVSVFVSHTKSRM